MVARAFSRTAGCDETEGGHRISVEVLFAGGAVAAMGSESMAEVSTDGGGGGGGAISTSMCV